MERPWVTSPSYHAAIRVLVAARRNQGLSQRELARRLGKPRSFVSKIESRERRLDIVEFILLAREMGIHPLDLLDSILSTLDGAGDGLGPAQPSV
jgi:transcriptional regulator with XRE-family HTH domain